MPSAPRVLVLDDDPEGRAVAAAELRREFGEVRALEAASATGLRYLLEHEPPDAVVTADAVSWGDHRAVVRAVKGRRPACPVVWWTASQDFDGVVEALRSGLDDCVRRGEGGRGLGSAVRDALERAAERRLARAAETAYRGFFEGAPIGLYRTTPEGVIVDANQAFADILGYPDPRVLHALRSTDLYADPAERMQVRAALERDGVVRRFPVSIRRRDGTTVRGALTSRTVKDGEGSTVFYEGALEDLTAREQAQAALRASEARYRALVEQVPAATYVATVDNGRTCYVSPQVERMLGWPVSDWLDAPDRWRSALHPEDHDRVLPAFAAPAGEGPLSVEYRMRTRDGRLAWIRDESTLLRDESGQPVARQGVMIDVTATREAEQTILRHAEERRSLEEQLRQSQKMDAVGRLAGGVAHDFNNLLTVITGYTELLLLNEPDDHRRSFAREVLAAADKAGAMTQQLLTFSKRQVLQPRILSLNAVLAEMDKLLRRLIGEDVELVVHMEGDLGHVRADPSQLEQVVLNLAVNARDAMPRGGRLVLSTANLELGAEQARLRVDVAPGSYVALSVTDSGTGMDAATRERIFEPFFTTKKRGTGLGLATVYGIVAQSGGHVAVESEPGRGSTSTVVLPRSTEMPAAGVTRREDRPRGGDETVLVLEDEDGVRDLARFVLASYGYRVLGARGSAEALRLGDDHAGDIHVLLADVVLSGRSGPEVARDLLVRRPGLKVIYMSGYTDEAISHHGVLDEGTRFLKKPFTPEALARKVREVLDGVAPAG